MVTLWDRFHKTAAAHVGSMMTDQWGEMLITGWNKKPGGWTNRALWVTASDG